MTNILLAGDNFIRNELLATEISAVLPFQPTFSELTLPWPQVPFGKVAEVDEAADCEDDLLAAVPGMEVIVTQMAPLTARVFQQATALRLVICTRGGPVNINLEAARQRGVSVSCTPGRNAVAAAEYTVLLMLAAMRRLPEAHNSVARGEWRSWMYDYSESGSEVRGATVGLVGLGEIGRRVAALVHGMGATVLAYDPFVSPGSVDGNVTLVSLEQLLESSDVVSLHARLTRETAHLMSGTRLAKMRPGSILVNTARGGLLDYEAAERALRAGHLRSLALDVFPDEPVPSDSRLLRLPQVVLSPHLAGATRDTARRATQIAAAEIGRYARSQPLSHVVNGVMAGAMG